MAEVSSDLDAGVRGAVASLAGQGDYRRVLSRAVFAVNDAGNLTDALDFNLDWMVRALATGEVNESVRHQLQASVEVCRQLTRLLGGALGSCRAAANTTVLQVASVRLSRAVENAVRLTARLADALGVLLLHEGPSDLWVAVEADLLVSTLETLLAEAVRGAPAESVVRVNYARCGRHAVLALTSDGPGLSTLQLEELYLASVAAHGDEGSGSGSSESRRAISTMLYEQGGHIDVEIRPDGGATLFIVVPASDEVIEEPVRSGTVLAQRQNSPRTYDSVPGQKRSETMIVKSDRFGAIEVDASDIVKFPSGIIGFPTETEFVIVRKSDSQIIGWLQSIKTSYLTLPVVSAHAMAARFPDVPIEEYADRAGLGSNPEELAILAVLSAPPNQPATVNLMAPIIVNATTRIGAQVLIEGTRFTTRELFVLPATPALDITQTATAMPNGMDAATSAAE